MIVGFIETSWDVRSDRKAHRSKLDATNNGNEVAQPQACRRGPTSETNKVTTDTRKTKCTMRVPAGTSKSDSSVCRGFL